MTYLVTIPSKFDREEHPFGVGPDDLIAVEAESNYDARVKIIDRLGRDGWCDVLDPGPERDEIVAKYYPGRIVPFEVTA